MTNKGKAGNREDERGPDQGADAVTVGSGLHVAASRTRPRDEVFAAARRGDGDTMT